MNDKLDVTTDNVIRLFFTYAIPTILGMMAICSASIIDGIFLGRYIGPKALAVINLIVPYVSFLLGITTMLSAGGCVLSGKLIGERNNKGASEAFSKVIQIMVFFIVITCILVLIFPYHLAHILGANKDIINEVVVYIKNYTYFLPFQLLGIGISFFARVNGKPGLSSFALLFSAIMNVILDFVLIVIFSLGIKGAALATGISQSMTFFILIPIFFSKKSTLHFVKSAKFTKDILFSMFNGISEFLNETSSGIVAFAFNHVLMIQSGVEGVAAFTTINFFLYSSCLIDYGVATSMNGPISINYGAEKLKRVYKFMKVSILFTLMLGICIASTLYLLDDIWITIFLKNKEEKISELALAYIGMLWPAFLINGINIVITGYFTSTLKPMLSFVFSILRSLLLPIIFILILNYLFMNEKVFLSIPLAEVITLFISLTYLYLKKRKELINR
ncbi:MATE family efflux transporter [Anaerosacchariphilus polymeriproducens]|uniref:MATE family efflux transporter n=1 Tax=Anaerosacchariphilus polymeriproducens TaxID=1812858 RepID=A0A371AYN1_9FIRM|nr:MATE family efflux transporter [Anaerosacchariphilus polymeriproducens]RDU24666.1 MATE family efflux transporter [Anaerosacchariphilus polymeriproducens]